MTKIIDQEVIDGLTEIGDQEFLNELIDIFLDQSEELARDIKLAVGAESAPELLKASHKLKGSCLNLGASELGNICARLEAKSKDNDLSLISDIMAPFDSVYQQTRTELSKLRV
jgi:HPt (histidine-containing phosphotransfer) domain-containing protein